MGTGSASDSGMAVVAGHLRRHDVHSALKTPLVEQKSDPRSVVANGKIVECRGEATDAGGGEEECAPHSPETSVLSARRGPRPRNQLGGIEEYEKTLQL